MIKGGWRKDEKQDCTRLTEGSIGRLVPLGGGGGGRVKNPCRTQPGLSGARRGLVLKLPIAHLFRKVLSFPDAKVFLISRIPLQRLNHLVLASTVLDTDSPTSQCACCVIESTAPRTPSLHWLALVVIFADHLFC